jgi:hypothetical protein
MSVRYRTAGSEFIPEKSMMLFQQASLGSGTTVRATYDVAPNGQFLLNQPIPEGTDERNRQIYPATLRLVFNWTDEIRRMLTAAH